MPSSIMLEISAARGTANEISLDIPTLQTQLPPDEKPIKFTIYRIGLLVALPLFVFGLLTGLGIMAVNLAAENVMETGKELAVHSARDIAAQFEMQIAQSLIPAAALRLLVEQQPSWPYWDEHFSTVAGETMNWLGSLDGTNESIWNIQLQPFGQIRAIYPFRHEDRLQIGIDLIGDPSPGREVYPSIQSQKTSITVASTQGFFAAYVKVPIFIKGTSADETFGYNFQGANYSTLRGDSLNVSYPPVPFQSYPLGYGNHCPICYIASNLTAVPPVPSSRFWGFIVSTINLASINKGRMASLYSEGYRYRLTKPINSTDSVTIVERGGVNLGKAVSVPITVPDDVWTLYVEPLNGVWYPSWKKPLTGGVVAISFAIALLVFLALFFYLKQKDQLRTTKVVNKALEDSTKSQLQVSKLLAEEVKRGDALLFRMLPPFAAEKLRRGQSVEAEDYPSVSILFTDIIGFTEICARCTPREVCQMLDQLYLAFDSILKTYSDLFKVETIGDAYMVVANLSGKCLDHADQMVQFGLRIQDATTRMVAPDGTPLRIRLGINSGHVVGGVIGSEMPHFCLFGNTVNTASRMESHGVPSRVHISKACYDTIFDKSRFIIEDRGMIEVKGKGMMQTYLVTGIHRFVMESKHLDSINLPEDI